MKEPKPSTSIIILITIFVGMFTLAYMEHRRVRSLPFVATEDMPDRRGQAIENSMIAYVDELYAEVDTPHKYRKQFNKSDKK